MRRIASPVAAIESTRSLRCVVRNRWRDSSSSNCSMAIMFTGPSRSILSRSFAMASSAVRLGRASASQAPAAAPDAATSAGWRFAALFAALLRLLGRDGAGVRHCGAVALHLFDFGEHLVERGLHGFGGLRGEVREVALGRGPRDLETRHVRADRLVVRTRLADRRFARIGVRMGRRDDSSSARTVARSSSSARTSASSARTPSAMASSRPARFSFFSFRSARSCTTRASSSRAASSSRCTSASSADGALRQARRGRLRFRHAVADALHASRARRRAAAAPCSAAHRPRAAPPRCGRSTRAPRPAARRAGRPRPRRAGARARAAPPCARAASRPRRHAASCASNPTMAFSCWCSSAAAAPIACCVADDRFAQRGHACGQLRDAPRARRRCARAARGSRPSSRECRAPRPPRRRTPGAPRAARRRRSSRPPRRSRERAAVASS